MIIRIEIPYVVPKIESKIIATDGFYSPPNIASGRQVHLPWKHIV